jgi:hypothetical protein
LKGALNKRTLGVVDKLTAERCDPVVGMARIAMNEKNPVELRARVFAKLAIRRAEAQGDGPLHLVRLMETLLWQVSD